MEYRIEHDTMGEVKVPVNALYRAQTQRCLLYTSDAADE
jgi:fumarate hydratase class II